MHYIQEGSGEPVVLVHGNPTWSFYYRNLVSKLKDKYMVIVPDHIGCGLSDKPSEELYEYTLSNRIEDLSTLLNKLIPDQPYRMVIHDWGGMIGLGAALKNPDRLRQLVILNTTGFMLPETRRFHKILLFARSLPGRILITHFNAFVRGTLRWGSIRKPMADEVRKAYLQPYSTPADRLAVLRFVQDIPLKSSDTAYDAAKFIDDNLHLISTVPKLVLWGRHDFIFDDYFLNEWKKRCPEAEFHVFEDAGHLVLEDAPERVCKKTKTFFDSHDGSM